MIQIKQNYFPLKNKTSSKLLIFSPILTLSSKYFFSARKSDSLPPPFRFLFPAIEALGPFSPSPAFFSQRQSDGNLFQWESVTLPYRG